MRQITDDIRNQLNIPRYDINDETSYTMNEPDLQTHETNSRYLHSQNGNQTEVKAEIHNEAEMNGTMETTLKSKASKESTEQSADTYNFKSTEDDDLYSTIRSEANNTANLTDTQTIKTYQISIKEMDEGEEEDGDLGEQNNDLGQQNGYHDHSQDNTNDDNDDEEDYEDDIYEDEGDDEDEEEEEVQQGTDPTATYRTDDDEF